MALFDAVRSALEEMEVGFEGDDAHLRFGARMENGQYDCFIDIDEEKSLVACYVYLSPRVPPNNRATVNEFLTRLNFFWMGLGNFEMHFDEGVVRCRTSIAVDGGKLMPPMVQALVHTGIHSLDACAPWIMKIVYANLAPTTAFESMMAELPGAEGNESGAADVPDEI